MTVGMAGHFILAMGLLCLALSGYFLVAGMIKKRMLKPEAGRLSDELTRTTNAKLSEMPMIAAKWLMATVDAKILRLIENYDRTPYLESLTLLIACVVLPLAALANYVQGGSAFLIICYVLSLSGLIFLMVLDVAGGGKRISMFLAAVVSASVFIALPIYALVALINHFVEQNFLWGVALAGLLAAMMFTATINLWTFFRPQSEANEDSGMERFCARVFMFLPISTLAYWLGLLPLYLFSFEVPPVRSNEQFFTFVVLFSFSSAISLTLIEKLRKSDALFEATIFLMVLVGVGVAFGSAFVLLLFNGLSGFAGTVESCASLPGACGTSILFWMFMMPVAGIFAGTAVGCVIKGLQWASLFFKDEKTNPFPVWSSAIGVFGLVLISLGSVIM